MIAVMSDIHGNYIALEKCIEYAINRGVDSFIFLGDYIGELAYPQKTMQILYSLAEVYKCYFIKGNKEDYWLNYESNRKQNWQEYDSTTGSLLYAYNNLTSRDLLFYKGLDYQSEVRLDGFQAITICHGSPNRTNEKLEPNSEKTFSIMDHNKNSIILCGHTHIQEKIEHNHKVVLNVGSVGLSIHSGGKAQFMILDGEKQFWNHEFVSLEYDVDKVIADLYNSGLCKRAPYWCEITRHLLKTGETSHAKVLTRAMTLCEQDMGQCNWPEVPEKYWNKAVRELIG